MDYLLTAFIIDALLKINIFGIKNVCHPESASTGGEGPW